MNYSIDFGGIAGIGLLITVCAIALILTWDYAFGSSVWKESMEICTDIWQQTLNETLYYQCVIPLERTLGFE